MSTARISFGARTARVEDPALLTGKGRFIDDIALPGTLSAVFVRSPHAHATVNGIDTRAARAAPGAHAVFTLDDLMPHLSSERTPPDPGRVRGGLPRPGRAAGEGVGLGRAPARAPRGGRPAAGSRGRGGAARPPRWRRRFGRELSHLPRGGGRAAGRPPARPPGQM